jgi:hypothetical protein
MPGLAVDTYGAVQRQQAKVDRIEGQLFELRRRLETEKAELERLQAASTPGKAVAR